VRERLKGAQSRREAADVAGPTSRLRNNECAPFRRSPFGPGSARARGNKNTVFTVSGYGLTKRTQEHSAVPNISFRERLMAASTLVNRSRGQDGGFNVQAQGSGSGRGGTCSGDSGGPVFLGGFSSNLIVAVTSFGLNSLCRGTDFGYRTDRQDVLSWIASLPKQ